MSKVKGIRNIFSLTRKCAIVGSRTFNDYDKLCSVLDWIKSYMGYSFDVIISGGAKGADSLAEQYAKDNNITLSVHPANWKKYGKRAGFLRNKEIIKNTEICVAFWNGISKGTADDIELCNKYVKECWIYNFEEGILYNKTLTIKEKI